MEREKIEGKTAKETIEVLLVENNPGDARLVEEYLKGSDQIQIKFSRVLTFEEAQNQCKERDFDLILLDLNLPDSEGLDTLIALKQNLPLIPIVVLTGFSNEDVGVEALRKGAQDYLKREDLKPSMLRRIIRHSVERKEMEIALEQASQNWRETFDAIPDLIFVLDENRKILRANKALGDFAGVHPKELIGQPCYEILHHTFKPIEDCPFLTTMETNQTCTREIFEPTLNCPFEITISPIFSPGESEKKYVHIVRDISSRKKMEKSLFESEMRLLTAIQESPFPAMIHREDGKVSMISKSWTETTGYHTKDIPTISAWIEKAYGPEKAKEVLPIIQHLYSIKEKICEGESEITTKKGEKRLWDFSSVPLGKDSEGKRLVMTMAVDITEKKRAEKNLIKSQTMLHQSQKMEAIGRLAGGVAHDFNNLLTVIIGGSELLMMNESLPSSFREEISQIQEAGKQAASLTRQLLTFSRQDIIAPEVINLNDLIRTTEKMLTRIIGEDIRLVTSLQMEIHKVQVDPINVQQILLNLAVNSRDAMPGGGTIRIETGNYTLNEPLFFEGRKAPEGEYVCLTVEDKGLGISPEIITNIFEPFFTTKEKGRGTGLGLSVVYGIVKQHRGWINVFSRVGEGATFKIYFPAFLKAVPQKDNSEKKSPERVLGKGERILFVEDESQIRDFITWALEKKGFIMFPAASAEEALKIYEEKKGEVDLLFSDVVLPKESGVWLAGELLKRNPHLKVLFSSGYTDQQVQWEFIETEGHSFLRKPYFITDLIKVLGKILGL